ncbi:MAG: hypothetical protein GXP49_17750, partial [Deltaproteobacteria bacterium]|nr:hypothetical protein [Deltaproteobacteria bacterium]
KAACGTLSLARMRARRHDSCLPNRNLSAKAASLSCRAVAEKEMEAKITNARHLPIVGTCEFMFMWISGMAGTSKHYTDTLFFNLA